MSTTTTQITLRSAVIIPFVMIFLFAIGVIVFVQKQSYEEVVADISQKQLSALTENVSNSLSHYLSEPFEAGLAINHSLSYNQLYTPNDTEAIQHYLLDAFTELYDRIPQLDVIGFGSEAADYIGFRKEADLDHTLMIQDDRTDSKLVIYRGSQVTEDIRTSIEGYDPRIRPWYAPVAESRTAMWSSIYANADERQEITLSALSPVYQSDEFVGVIVTDIRINTFNSFLSSLQEKTKASVFIVDEEQRMVAHSGQGSVVSWGTDLSEKGQRLFAYESSDPIIRTSAEIVNTQALAKTGDKEHFSFDVNNQRYFSLLSPYQDEFGLTWYIGISISEEELLGLMPKSQRDSWIAGLIVSLVGVAFTILIFNRITQPITSTATAAKHLAKGDWDSNMPRPGLIYETNLLVHAFNEMASNLRASFKALRNQLVYDSLTKLYSREGLIDASLHAQDEDIGSLYLIGVNRFRDINDSIGHHNGDQLLVGISERLKSILSEDYLLARTGGDEFAVYAPRVNEQQDITLLVSRLQQIFAAPFVMDDDNVIMKVSIGVVSTMPEHDMGLWLRNGSIALSNAKQDVTGVSYYSPEMASASKFRTQMLARIQDGLDNKEFVPYYQPIIDLNSGKIIGAEALARWLSKQGIVSPLDFIPIAEDSGMIQDIGHHILRKACYHAANAIQTGLWESDFNLHVNVSVHQLSRPDFVGEVEGILAESHLSPSNLTLEITESRIVDSAPTTLDNMHLLRKLGVSIAIDDFGTGYSSLAYLHSLPFDCLKIDRAFIDKLTAKELDNSVVAAVVNITRGFKVNLVAEGVETQTQADLLIQLGCPQAQGYLFSRPVPFEDWPTNLVNMK